MDVQKEIDELRHKIRHHSRLYYVYDKPEISDYEFDMLMQRLKTLEALHPELVTPDSPTQRIGDVTLPQFEQVRQVMDQKWPDAVYIPYFQAHTNTYAPLEVLKEKFEEALSFPDVMGLAIATRADCITDEIADYLGELAQRTYLEVELGLQSVHDVTGERINRCHSYADFLEGYQKLADRGINICVHIIDGLPGEDREMMLETARRLSHLHLHSIKIHLLHVLKGTVMEQQLAEGQFRLLTREEYVGIVCGAASPADGHSASDRRRRTRVAGRAGVESQKAVRDERNRQRAGSSEQLSGKKLSRFFQSSILKNRMLDFFVLF